MKKKKLLILACLILATASNSLGNAQNMQDKNMGNSQSSEIITAKYLADQRFSELAINNEIFARMQGKSYPEACPVPLEDLRYLTIPFYGFDGKIHQGEMIVNKKIAQDVLNIFWELYQVQYPIEKMQLIDNYNANDNASMNDNNSSAFCYRTISGSKTISNHGLGLAVDINPFYNPYIRRDCLVEPPEAKVHATHRDPKNNPYYISAGDFCVSLFKKYGFEWGGDWEDRKDYQHFAKVK